MADKKDIRNLTVIPGIGKSIAHDLWVIGIHKVSDLSGQNPDSLYDLSNNFHGKVQDRCLLYAFRCAVYFTNTPIDKQDPEKLKWWNWKDKSNKK